jgi:hypothetical protein
MNTPYIGITDFTDFEQVKAMLEAFEANKPKGSNRKLHIGVMMSYKTLNDIPCKWLKVFPRKELIADIFSSDETFNCLHYADYVGQPDLADTLVKAISFGGIGIHALQLDMVWPDSGVIEHAVHTSRKNIQVILQVGDEALDQVNDDPDELVEMLREYHGIIHRVLLDRSMGRGIGMDADMLLPFARVIKENFPDIGIGVAGGLGPDTMHLVEPFLEEFPDLSWDAQAKLHPDGDILVPIDWKSAKDYLTRSLQLVG